MFSVALQMETSTEPVDCSLFNAILTSSILSIKWHFTLSILTSLKYEDLIDFINLDNVRDLAGDEERHEDTILHSIFCFSNSVKFWANNSLFGSFFNGKLEGKWRECWVAFIAYCNERLLLNKLDAVFVLLTLSLLFRLPTIFAELTFPLR